MSRKNRANDHSSNRRRGAESGQSLVEFAILLPVLMAIVLGIFEFGRAWNVYQVLTNTAREGARLAVIPTSTEQDVRDVIELGLTNAALDPALGDITIVGATAQTGQPATVQLQYPYTFEVIGPIVALLGPANSDLGGSITLSTTVRMRNE